MAIVVDTSTTASQTVVGNTLLVTNTGAITSATGTPVALLINSRGIIAGTVAHIGTSGFAGIRIDGSAVNTDLTVTSTGSVFSYGASADGIFVLSPSARVTVSGTVQADDIALGFFGSAGVGDFTITSTGVVQGGSDRGIESTSVAYSAAVLGARPALSVINAGTIISDPNVQTGERIAIANAVQDSSRANLLALDTISEAFIVNTGSIFGDLFLSAGIDTVENSGSIHGDVSMGRDADSYTGTGGQVFGRIDMGDGNDFAQGGGERDIINGQPGADTLIGRDGDDSLNGGAGLDSISGGKGDDSLIGGNDADTINGGSDNDTLDGGSGNDNLLGNDGDDSLIGGNDNDVLRGGLGNDTLLGSDGTDSLFGSAGDDSLNGGAQGDTIRGGEGDDTLFAGNGIDFLTGGAGEDIFLFTNVSQSANNADRDRITDFESGTDKLDIAALFSSAPSTTYFGTQSFDGSSPGVRVFFNSGGDAVVFVDTNGNGSAETRYLLFDVTSLTVDDFILT